MRLLTPILLLSLAIPAYAQTAGAGFGRGIVVGSSGSARIGVRAGAPPVQGIPHHGVTQPVWFGSSWLADYGQSIPQQSQPTIVVIQAPAQPATPPEPAKTVDPLMIELRGNQFVRLRASDSSATPASESTVVAAKETPQANPHPDLPAVLVFRDGHQEQVHQYTIADGFLYAQGNMWTDGYWTKTIALSQLDLPASIKANHERGVDFALPHSPREVMVGP